MGDEHGMSSFNLLSGSDTSKVLGSSWYPVIFNVTKCEFGTPYALSVTYDSSADGLWFQTRFNYWSTDGKASSLSDTPVIRCTKGKHVATATIPSFDKPDDFARAVFMVQAGYISGKGTIEISRPMLVEGDTPAAWAPAEGETLAGVGSLMSANLWDASAVNFKPDADGVYICGTSTGELNCSIAGASALSANQTVHFGASLRGAGKGYLSPFVEYRNAVGNLNWVGFPAWTPTDQWQRFEATCVVPSGMTITKIGFNTSGATGDIEVMNPAWSYGSPVCLASSAHTPYATQDHVSTIYATKASLKVTDDSIKAEVSERGKLAGRVGTLESASGTHTSKLEQLAASIKSLVKGESTYTDPDGKSATSGIYSLVTQTRDSVTALFGQYTKTADLASTQAVKDAKKAGTDAQAAASAAQTTADSAKSTAQAAASDAATAKANAASAVSTANGASTSAANAVKTANAASSTASSASSKSDSAVSTANAAKTSAASAVSTANAASSTAGAAKSTADAAKSNAATAQSTADRAQSTADAALDNAGTANGRVRAVEARFAASIDGLDVRVRGVSEAVSAQGATVRDVERNMSFGLDGLVIGAADSASKVRITEKRETFEVDGKTVLALDGDTSTVEASALKTGGYVWTATNGGKNLTLVYRG